MLKQKKYTMKKESKDLDYYFDLYEFLEDDSVNNDNYIIAIK